MKTALIKEIPQSVQKAARKVWEERGQEPININAICYTYGDTCYTQNSPLPKHLEVHERTHTKQQGEDPDGWWERYGDDPLFRYEQELEAYRNQYRYFKSITTNREQVFRFAVTLAQQMASPMYGNMCTFSNQLVNKIVN